LLKKHHDKGLLVKSGGDAMMGPISNMGGGGWCSFEQFTAYDITNRESIKGAVAYIKDAIETCREHGWSTGFDVSSFIPTMTTEQRKAFFSGMAQPSVLYYQWQVKQLLDPNDTGDSEIGYPTLEKQPK
jgi:hypothetical protein